MEDTNTIPLTKGKKFKIELMTNKNNSYLIDFSLQNSIEIEANQISDLSHKSFSNKFSLKQMKVNKYFQDFNSLKDIFDELNDRIINDKIITEENENNLIINIPLSSYQNKEVIIFGLKQKIKNDNEKINNLKELIIQQNKEIDNLKNEVINLKNEVKYLKNYITNSKDEEKELKEKVDLLWERDEKKKIANLNSKIIKDNEYYNKRLKKWINPLKKIKAELLYRLSEHGDKFSTFHELCDNKGPTLTLFQVNDGNNVGIYTPLSWDTNSNYKKDMDTFIFNLNENRKFKKLKSDYFFYCNRAFGPYTSDFGCFTNSMKSIKLLSSDINKYYDKGSEILPSNNKEKEYNLLETEVYKIIFE